MTVPKTDVITPGSFIIPSGRSSSVERVVERMVPLAQDGLDIRIHGIRGSGKIDNRKLHGIPLSLHPGGRKYAISVIRSLRSRNPQVVDVQNRPLLAYRIKTSIPHAAVALSLHSLTFISPPYLSPSQASKLLLPLDALILNSNYLKREVSARIPWISEKIRVNPLGTALSDFSPRWTPQSEGLREARLQEMGWEGRKIVLYAGRLLPIKGVHHVIAALPELVRSIPEVMVVVVGSPFYNLRKKTSYEAWLHELARPYSRHVTFIPFIPYPGIAKWYNLADIVVVPSEEGEAFGLVNVEAMAAAVPIVASTSGGIPEVVEDGVTGLLVPPERLGTDLAERMVSLLQDEDLRQRMGQAGRSRVVQRYRWEHTAMRWREMMQKLAGQ